MNCSFPFKVLILFQFINQVFGWKYQIRPTKAKGESLTDKVQLNISMTESGGLSLYIYLKEDLNDLYTTVNLAVNLHTTDEYDFDLIKRTVNCCKLFKDRSYEPEVQALYKIFSENGHFPVECPVKKALYYIDDFNLDPGTFPQLMSGTKAFLIIKHSFKEKNKFKNLANYQVYFTVEKTDENVTESESTAQSNSKKEGGVLDN